jgi:hypothetical protein
MFVETPELCGPRAGTPASGWEWRAAAVSFARRYPLAAPLAACQAVLVIITVPWYSAYGLRVDWNTAWPLACGYAVLAAMWLYMRRYASDPVKHAYPDAIVATALILLLTNVVAPAQYLAVALRRPLIDGWLAHADAAMGVHVPALAVWTSTHAVARLLFTICYVSLMPQFVLPMALLALRFGDRERLWEFTFHFHFCLIATLAALATIPAAGPFVYYGSRCTLDFTQLIAQFSGLRSGTFHVIRLSDMQGLISMPSFHAAGGLMVAWAFRGYRRITAIVVLLNIGLIAATVMTGAHYAVDVVASVLLFAISVCVYRLWAADLVRWAASAAF